MAEQQCLDLGGKKSQPLDFKEKIIIDAGIQHIEWNMTEGQKWRVVNKSPEFKNLVHSFILKTMFHIMNVISYVEIM